MNDFIYLNSKLFLYITRQFSNPKIGGNIERTLSGKAIRDTIVGKSKWTFTFECDYREYLRLKSIFDLNSSFVLKDWDSTSYTVLVANQFSPQFDGTYFAITLELEEV